MKFYLHDCLFENSQEYRECFFTEIDKLEVFELFKERHRELLTSIEDNDEVPDFFEEGIPPLLNGFYYAYKGHSSISIAVERMLKLYMTQPINNITFEIMERQEVHDIFDEVTLYLLIQYLNPDILSDKDSFIPVDDYKSLIWEAKLFFDDELHSHILKEIGNLILSDESNLSEIFKKDSWRSLYHISKLVEFNKRLLHIEFPEDIIFFINDNREPRPNKLLNKIDNLLEQNRINSGKKYFINTTTPETVKTLDDWHEDYLHAKKHQTLRYWFAVYKYADFDKFSKDSDFQLPPEENWNINLLEVRRIKRHEKEYNGWVKVVKNEATIK